MSRAENERLDLVFGSEQLRTSLRRAIEQGYLDSHGASANYGPWVISRWALPHDSRGRIICNLYEAARSIPGISPVLIDNPRRSFTYLTLQTEDLLILPTCTHTKTSLGKRPRYIPARLAQPSMLPLLDDFSYGHRFRTSDPLFVVLAYGEAKQAPGQLAWLQATLPDELYRSRYSRDLLHWNNDFAASADDTTVTEIDAVVPRMKERRDRKETTA